ncbi:MAG: ImmA/IrrE family metallo-endopeptidase [Bradyrhizobium sp.]|nr:ImmA/IrrE family metallo-endopeptidase [Bradyrhizobium sp.]
MTRLSAAERLLQDLGVTEPKEIDLEAIAFHLGARVRYRALEGCEAQIVGCNECAIITVNRHSAPRRKRFSIAHELGHWCYHRGERLTCRAEEIRPRDPTSPERVADNYAADLLMPLYLFEPAARAEPKFTFKAVLDLAEKFETSVTATAIRLVEAGRFPALLVCHGSRGKKWFTRNRDVPTRWFPRADLDSESFAFGVLFGGKTDDPMPRKIGADAWFERRDADRYMLLEQTFRTGSDEILTLVTITDEEMLEE